MKKSVSSSVLPNGMKAFYLNKNEMQFIYDEIPNYFKHGIAVHEGDTVFDVGANIGIFSLYVNHQYHQNVNIYAFEPVPSIYQVLQLNFQHLANDKIKLFPCGLSLASQTVTFAYHPNAPAMSSAYFPNLSPEEIDKYKTSMLRNLKDAPDYIRRLRWVPPFLRTYILERAIQKTFQVEQVTCNLRSISEIIDEYHIQTINLLKIDVEKSELDVLLGINPKHWSKIMQLVMEVHDIDHRVDKIKALLQEHGFSKIILEQEPFLQGSQLYNLYALR
ncbi:FkbM family methyltransferase [Nostoc sp. UHCC 0702]|nr:FkbM family methyltransferase [Nostoc sp. UHCC 0702]